MVVKIRMKKGGKTHAPFYHLVVSDERKSRDGRFIEILGTYNPRSKDKDKRFDAKKDRIEYWLSKGAKPTETVSHLIRGL